MPPTEPKRVRSSSPRITLEALKYYVPLYQAGHAAEQKLLEQASQLSCSEKNSLQTIAQLKELSARKIADLSGPLITREIMKLISTSHLKGREDLFEILFFAGVDGMKRGLLKFDVDKMNQSSTNYLFQWIVTYARKELSVLEAPYGIPPSRFQKYKKISAVRKKISDQQKSYASNQQVYEYFQSGQADLVTMTGKLANRGQRSQANLKITLELIAEQEAFEKNMLSTELLNPLGDSHADREMSTVSTSVFSETVFGAFMQQYSVRPLAKAVLLADMNSPFITVDEVDLLDTIDDARHKEISFEWRRLIRDPNGLFYKFLLENSSTHFEEFDLPSLMSSIKNSPSTPKNKVDAPYDLIFESPKETEDSPC